MLRNLVVVAVLCGSGLGMQAQTGAAAGHSVSASQAADGLLNNVEKDMLGVVRAMPADKFDFTPASLHIPGAKFEGVRTFAEEVTHVAQANYHIYSRVGEMKPDRDVSAIGQLKRKDEVLAGLEASFAFAHQAIAKLNAETATAVVEGGPFPATRQSLAAYGVAHARDHYGQMVEYLRMNGVVPPGSK